MEFKTCEERVLYELNEAEKTIAEKEEHIENLNVEINWLESKINKFNKIFELFGVKFNISESKDVITLNSDYIYKWRGEEEFDEVIKLAIDVGLLKLEPIKPIDVLNALGNEKQEQVTTEETEIPEPPLEENGIPQ